MADIIHYEVYAFQKDKNNWNLLARYSGEQKAKALEHAKNVEKEEHCQAKVVRENYDLNTQEFRESMVYLSASPSSPPARNHRLYSNTGVPSLKLFSKDETSDKKLAKSIFVLIFLTVFSLIMASLLTAGLAHIVVQYKLIVPESSSLFSLISFICFFLLLFIPIGYKTIDWDAFMRNKTVDNKNQRSASPGKHSAAKSSLPHLAAQSLHQKNFTRRDTEQTNEDIHSSLLFRMVQTVIDSFDLLMGRKTFSQRLQEDKENLLKEIELSLTENSGENTAESIEEPIDEQEQTEEVDEAANKEEKEEDEENKEEKQDNLFLSPEVQEYYMQMTSFLSVILRVLRNKNILLNTYARFGLELFLAGACEQMCQKNNLSKQQNQIILSGVLALLGRSATSAETFFYKLEEYALEAKYLPMIESGAKGMYIYSTNNSSPELISLAESAMENWLRPDQKDMPSFGICTIMFTDMVSSTHMTQVLGDHLAQQLVRLHNSIVRKALQTYGGIEIKQTGDGIMASFMWASNAIDAAIAIQKAVAEHNLQAPTVPLEIRIGLNSGEPIVEDNDLFGHTVQLASRVCGQAGANQIYVSSVVKELSAGKNYTFESLGDVLLKGIDEPQPLYEVVWNKNNSISHEEVPPAEEKNIKLSAILPEL